MPEKNISRKKRNAIILALIVLFGVFLRIIFFYGIDASDGLQNTKYSYDLSKGIFPTAKNQANSRIGLLIPVSVLYSKFGINDLTSTILVLLASIGGIVLIYFFGKFLFGDKVGLLAAFLLSFFPLDVLYATRFLSDLPSAFFAALSVFLFLKAEKEKSNSNSCLLYIFSGLSLGMAFSIREMAALLILFFAAYVIYNRKFKAGYFLSAIVFLFILALEMYFFYSKTGNPFYRFNSLATSYVQDSIRVNFYGRLSFPEFFLAWPYVMFANIQLGYFYAFISLAIFYWLFNRKKETNYLLMWFLLILIYFNYGTSGISGYVPFLAVARYLSFITVPGILLLAAFLMENKDVVKKAALPFILIFLFFTSIGGIYLDESRHGLSNLKEAYSYMKSINKPIYTDARSKFALEYISGYDNSLNLIDLEAYAKDLAGIRDSYIVLNNKMIKNFKNSGVDLKFVQQLKEASKNWVELKEIGNGPDDNVIIYHAG